MSIEKVFESKFETVVQQTYLGGAKAAPLAGFGYALGGSLTYFAEGDSPPDLPLDIFKY